MNKLTKNRNLMKTTIPMVALFLLFQQTITAQNLNNKVEQSIVTIGTTLKEIPAERLLLLDQVAYSLFKKSNNNKKTLVVFIDQSNQELSQLASIWLKTGLFYYGRQDRFNIQSAGINPKIKALSSIASLNDYGFKTRKVRGEHPMTYKIKYGSGSWLAFPKALKSLPITKNDPFKIVLEQTGNSQNEDSVELFISEPNSIAREMLYITTRINHLINTSAKTQ